MTQKSKICEKKTKSILQAEQKMQKIISKINNLKLTDSYVSKLTVFYNKKEMGAGKKVFSRNLLIIISFILATIYCYYAEYFNSTSCYIEMPSSPKAMFRPALSCEECSFVLAVERISNISAQEFEDKYAYSMQPVIVTDATYEWRALKDFDYTFFKTFYSKQKMGSQINNCFFFPYKSGFNYLSEVFSMDANRANLTGEPWYVGWSSCHDEETRVLRSYYDRPYFLPLTAESDMVDWIFMGGPGQGAHMHVDSVRHMSWQAQIRGRKQWELSPPPECLYSCSSFSFVVHPGEILVVDTNRWYHRTSVQPGDISITIGAEYD